MKAVLPFIPLAAMMLLVPAFYGIIIKFSARLLRSKEITWKKGFFFGIIILILNAILSIVANSMGYPPPFVIGILFGFIVNLVIGFWFFSTRGKSADGQLLGWGGAIKLTGISYVIFIFLGILLFLMSKGAFAAMVP